MRELDLIASWLPAQRWFAGKGRPIQGVTKLSTSVLQSAEPHVRIVLVRVDYVDGDAEDYQLLLARRASIEERLEHAVLGTLDGEVVYDAVHDLEASQVLLRLLASGADVEGVGFTPCAEIDATMPGRVMTAEQSNTSLVYGDAVILKLFRRVQPGENPDVEVTKALAAAGSAHVAGPLGWIDGEVRGERTTLGLLQPYLKNSSDGWAMATASVRDLFAEGDLHADEVGGDFAAEAERLGVATGEVHHLLAQALPSRQAGTSENQDTARLMHSRLDAAVAVVPELSAYSEGIRHVYDNIARRSAPVPVQRIHGDYHLGQVLRTQDGWVLLDFEGEPTRPLAERRALMCPLRDVAGMLRSFDYAARHLLAQQPSMPHLAYRASEWAERNTGAFCDGYSRAVGADPRDEVELLAAFELDKAVYEVVYEARNRPAWLPVPLGAIERLIGVAA